MFKWMLLLSFMAGAYVQAATDEELRALVRRRLDESCTFSGSYRVVVAEAEPKTTLDETSEAMQGLAVDIYAGYEYSVVFSKGTLDLPVGSIDMAFCTLFDGSNHLLAAASNPIGEEVEAYEGALRSVISAIDSRHL